MKVTDFSVDRPVTISMMVLIVIVVGVISLSRLGMDLLPDIDFPTLSMMVRYPGAPSEEVESVVCKPYEGSVASVQGVKRIQSISQEDVCYILVDFVWGTDLDAAASDIREMISFVEPYLPDDVEQPVVIKFSLTSMPLSAYAVWGMSDTATLKKRMEDSVQDRLERLEGIAQAPFFGGRTREIQVEVDRAALLGSGVSLETVALALGAQNLNLPAGRQRQARSEVLLRTIGMYDSLDEMRNTVVGAAPATFAPIRLGSVANVREGFRDVRNLVRANGNEAVMFMVMKESGANPLDVRRRFLEEFEAVKELLPPDVQFGMLFDMGHVIEMLVDAVTGNGLLGAFLSVVVMYAFLRSIRPTLTIALVIPLSVLATTIPIYVSGDTLNMMTMGGLVLGIGMLVDNAVVVIENVYRHIELGNDRKTAAKVGASQVGMAITASTLTTVVVFLPILFSTGLAGRLAKGLALTVAAALFASLFVAITIVPMLASVFFSTKFDESELSGGRLFRGFRARYERLLDWCLHHRVKTVASVTALLVATLALSPLLGAEFMPPTDDPIITAKVSFPVGTSIEETARATDRVEAVARQFPDIELVGSMIGADENDPTQALSEANPTGVHEAVLFMRLKDKEFREIPSNQRLQALLRGRFPQVEGMSIEFQTMGGGMGEATAPVDIKLFGPELEVLGEWSKRVEEAISGVEGIADVRSTLKVAKPERHIRIDRDKAASYGLTVGQVAMAVKNATLGTTATRYREKGEEVDVRVRYAESFRDSTDALQQVLIETPLGATIPLAQVASLEEGLGPVKITREDQTRRISVQANLEGVDLATAMKGVARAVDPLKRTLPPGYDIQYGGQFKEMTEAFVQLGLALVLAVLMVYMVMAAQFESFAHPFTIMFTMPLALIGVVLIFFFTGTTLSVPSFLGVIMLAGIVVNNGIVMVDFINQLRAEGVDILSACREGAATRLRPVLITSLTTIFGMVPMAVSKAQGSETMAPIALTIIGGLWAATAFTLIVVPVVYVIVDRVAERLTAFWLRTFHRHEVEGA